MTDAYDVFLGKIREIGQLESVESMLDWDQETLMPPNALGARSEQLSVMAKIIHERKISDKIGQLLAKFDGSMSDPVAATNIREVRRQYERAVKVPPELVGRIARVSALAKAAWARAREASDFPAFAPHLAELLELKREVADRIGFQDHRYDALLDEFEPGASISEITKLFSSLRGPLTELTRQITASRRQPDTSILHRHFPQASQAAFARKLATAIGFDFNGGRLDVSVHPFCSGTSPGDVRLTTRYNENFFNAAIFGVLHEAGHGLYEQGLDPEYMFTPMGLAVSLGIHESQSLMWENMVGRSRPFWEHFYRDCQAAFPQALRNVELDSFVAAINAVQPSLIRVEADEVTYNLHIILRFELELAMLEGSLAVDDIPEAWNAKMKELLGITVSNDREGCLQDIHWSAGSFGYFPTYALGKLYGAQFYAAARRAIPDLTGQIRKGEFRSLLEWLRTNIYRHGMRYQADELVRAVTGEALSTEAFMDYLRAKFSSLYGL